MIRALSQQTIPTLILTASKSTGRLLCISTIARTMDISTALDGKVRKKRTGQNRIAGFWLAAGSQSFLWGEPWNGLCCPLRNLGCLGHNFRNRRLDIPLLQCSFQSLARVWRPISAARGKALIRSKTSVILLGVRVMHRKALKCCADWQWILSSHLPWVKSGRH